MTRLRRVRALHLAPCTLHTYLIGCAASQRNNIATIHHTSAVNKTSGSFCHPRAPSRRSSRRALTLSPWSFHFFLLSIPLSLIPVPCSSLFLLSLSLSLSLPLTLDLSISVVSSILFSLSDLRSPTAYSPGSPIYLIFSSLPFFSLVLSVPSPFFARLIFSPLAHPPVSSSLPLAHIFFLSAFPPRSTSIRFPLCVVGLFSLSPARSYRT